MRPKPLMATFTLASVTVLTAVACGWRTRSGQWTVAAQRTRARSPGNPRAVTRYSRQRMDKIWKERAP